jgi:hypothetical protein
VVVFAGLEEGSLALWDLREDNVLHQSVTVPSSTSSSSSPSAAAHTFVLRAASFTTDSLPSSNHEAPVRRVAALDEHDLSSLAMGRPQNSAQIAIAQATAARDEAKASSSSAQDDNEDAAAAFNVMALTGGGGATGGVAGAAGGGDGGMLGGVSFQLASLDDTGSLFVWSSIELSSETLDPAGSEADLGLAPGARVKLVRSAVLRDGNMHAKAANNKGKSGSGNSTASGLGTQSFDVVFKPNETNEFVLSLGRGQVRRGRRYGAPVLPADYYQHAREQRLGDDCTTLCFHPLHPQFFLAGFKSGSVSLFNLSSSEALQTWVSLFSTAEGDRMSAGYSSAQAGVQALSWSQQRPSVFFVTDARGKTVVFDLLRSAQKPVATVALQPDSSSSSMSNGLPVPGQTSAAPTIRPKPLLSVSQTVVGSPLALNQSLIAFPSASSSSASTPAASVEVHQLKPALATSSDKERRQFAEYLEHVHQL